ncbi:MAG: hypothetical protein IKF91_05425 [Bacilli bacterium]|nr:hypothetical protein [Bacilli bacterium]
MFNILENLLESTLNLEKLLYNISKIKEIDPVLKTEFQTYEKEFIKIRGNYFELFKEIDEDIEEENLNIKGTKEFCEEFVQKKTKEEIKHLLEVIYKLSKISLKIIQINELKKEKEEIIKSLNYIISKEEIKQKKIELELLFKKLDIEKIKEYLINLQEIIKEDFKNKITNVDDYKKGDNFRFLCHSVSFTQYDKKRQKKYTSTSLLTPNHTKTYRLGFGFIMKPEGIICASKEDAFTDITAKDNQKTVESIIPRIDSIEKIESESTNYSEILLEGFNPIGIFCLTDGSKSLNLNYLKAHELQKYFPHLKIIDIDLTLYKEGLTEIRNTLINHINAYLGRFEEVDYDKYEEFFQKYLELKKEKELTEEEIINLFNKYQNKKIK